MKTKVVLTLAGLSLGSLVMQNSFAEIQCATKGADVICTNYCPTGTEGVQKVKVSVATPGVQRVSYGDMTSNYLASRDTVSSLDDTSLTTHRFQNNYKLACGDWIQFKNCAETQLDTQSLQKMTTWTPCDQALKLQF